MSPSSEDHEEEAMAAIKSSEASLDKASRWRKTLARYLSFVFIETFTMNFFAEWGDRSQVSTILLAAREVRENQCPTQLVSISSLNGAFFKFLSASHPIPFPSPLGHRHRHLRNHRATRDSRYFRTWSESC